MICLLVMTDGRDCIEQTIESAVSSLRGGPITRRIIHDDSGDAANHESLCSRFPGFHVVWNPKGRQGFGGAIRSAWSHLGQIPERYIFHLEDDFTFNRDVPLEDVAQVLDGNPHIAQMALRRQAWNATELAAGGVIECQPDEYTERSNDYGMRWLEHRLFWTTNPSLYRTDLTRKHPWPRGGQSEGRFGLELTRSPKVRFGYWGARDDEPWVHHIGNERVGSSY